MDAADREHRRLRRVHDGAELVDAVHAEVRDREGAALQVVEAQPVRARPHDELGSPFGDPPPFPTVSAPDMAWGLAPGRVRGGQGQSRQLHAFGRHVGHHAARGYLLAGGGGDARERPAGRGLDGDGDLVGLDLHQLLGVEDPLAVHLRLHPELRHETREPFTPAWAASTS